MNIYITIVIVAVIIAICYLANLYANVNNWKIDKISAFYRMKEANGYLFRILGILEDMKDEKSKTAKKD